MRQADSAYSRAGTSKDRAAVVAMYAPDAVMYPPAEATASGLDATLNMADLTFTGPNGKPVSEHSRDFHVWRKQPDGSWKLVIDIWNDLPPATPASK